MSKTSMLEVAYNFTKPAIEGNNFSANTLLAILEEACDRFVEHLFKVQSSFCAFFTEDFDSESYYCSEDLAEDVFNKYYLIGEQR